MIGFIERLLEHPAVYAAWQAPFVSRKFAPIERHLRHQHVFRILDVGCGPGTNAARFASAEYVGVDINERYLAIARSKHRGRFVQADLLDGDISDLGTFDTIIVNSFLHHLPDAAVNRILEQLQQMLQPQGRIHVLELVLPERPSLSRLMAKIDRGQYTRSMTAWRGLFLSHFDPVVLQPYWLGGRLWSMVYFQGQLKPCASP